MKNPSGGLSFQIPSGGRKNSDQSCGISEISRNPSGGTYINPSRATHKNPSRGQFFQIPSGVRKNSDQSCGISKNSRNPSGG